MRITMGVIALVFVGLMALNVGLISAQEPNTIRGTVTDATTGEPIEGAVVQVDGVDPVLSTNTDASGAYEIGDVPIGEHSVTASADGYDSETVGAEVSGTEGASIGFTLQPLNVEEEEPVPEPIAEEPEADDEVGKAAGDRQGYVGTFTSGTGAFTLTTKRGEIEIQIPEEGLEPITRTPGQAGGSLENGSRIAVLVEFVDQGAAELAKVAQQIIVKPAPQLPIVGAVVSITTDESGARTLSIMRRDGTTKEVQLGPDADPPEIGDLVTAFRGRSLSADGEAGQEGPPVVRGLVRAEEVRQRLEGFLEDLTAGVGELPTEAAERRAQRVADVAALLDDHASKHVEIILRVSQNEKLPPQAVQGMRNGLERAQRGRDQAKVRATEARAKAGPPSGRGGRGSQSQGGPGSQGEGAPGGQGQGDQGGGSQGGGSQGGGSQGGGSQGGGSQGGGSQGQGASSGGSRADQGGGSQGQGASSGQGQGDQGGGSQGQGAPSGGSQVDQGGGSQGQGAPSGGSRADQGRGSQGESSRG